MSMFIIAAGCLGLICAFALLGYFLMTESAREASAFVAHAPTTDEKATP